MIDRLLFSELLKIASAECPNMSEDELLKQLEVDPQLDDSDHLSSDVITTNVEERERNVDRIYQAWLKYLHGKDIPLDCYTCDGLEKMLPSVKLTWSIRALNNLKDGEAITATELCRVNRFPRISSVIPPGVTVDPGITFRHDLILETPIIQDQLFDRKAMLEDLLEDERAKKTTRDYRSFIMDRFTKKQ